jgi:hypothetical protein
MSPELSTNSAPYDVVIASYGIYIRCDCNVYKKATEQQYSGKDEFACPDCKWSTKHNFEADESLKKAFAEKVDKVEFKRTVRDA